MSVIDTFTIAPRIEEFCEETLVTWHYQEGNQRIPIPGVVVRKASDSIIIKARIQGRLEEVQVTHEQLVIR